MTMNQWLIHILLRLEDSQMKLLSKTLKISCQNSVKFPDLKFQWISRIIAIRVLVSLHSEQLKHAKLPLLKALSNMMFSNTQLNKPPRAKLMLIKEETEVLVVKEEVVTEKGVLEVEVIEMVSEDVVKEEMVKAVEEEEVKDVVIEKDKMTVVDGAAETDRH